MPHLLRISKSENQWGPIVRHTENFQPPKYIQKEINRNSKAYGVNVDFNGEPAIFYKSYWAAGGRVTFELDDGWYYISNEGNHENLNHTLKAGMQFKLR